MKLHYDIDPSCQLPREFLANTYHTYFPLKTDGTYVEVGAYDGVKFGHTSALAKLGWRGLCLEPHPEFAKRCRENHKNHNVVVDECAVGASCGEVTLYVTTHENGACSSTKITPATRKYGADEKRSIKVQMQTLDALLQRNNISPGFEVLTIDVEEAELEVLSGFDIGRWKPKLVIIETHEKDPNPIRNWKASKIGKFFADAGYKKIYADHINTVFVFGDKP